MELEDKRKFSSSSKSNPKNEINPPLATGQASREELAQRAQEQVAESFKLSPFDYEKIALDSFVLVIGKFHWINRSWVM